MGKKFILVVILSFCLLQGALINYYTSSLSSQDDASMRVREERDQQLPPPSISTPAREHFPHSKSFQQPNFVQEKHNVQHQSIVSILPSPSPSAAAKDRHDPCSDSVCTGHLKYGSFETYRLCEMMAYHKTLVPSQDIPKQCKFRDSRGSDPVALVSVPGSGNTWVRRLLEKATGICTGSIYCDAPLRVRGFVGEYIHDGSVLVVKTHTSDFQWKGTKLEKRNHGDALYSSAILLIRNPFDTFVSERHRSILLLDTDTKLLASQRLHGVGNVGTDDDSHVNAVSKEAFGNNTEWNQFVHNISKRWQKTIVKWSTSRQSRPLLVVRYEDMKKDVLKQVIRMLDFLRQDYNSTELAESLKSRYDEFQRSHGKAEFQHYTPEQKDKVNRVILQTIDILKENELDHLFEIKEYLASSN